jgi:outer membrane lipoprotein-sorting protein
MKRFHALALLAAPLAVAAAPAASPELAMVSAHLKAVDTMTADFAQTDKRGNTLTGTLSLKRPGRIRFQYARGVNFLVVADGKRLNVIDYDVKKVQSLPINDTPLDVLLDPSKDLARFATVIPQADPRVILVEARDPRRRELGTITMAFAKVAGAPGGLMLSGWSVLDAQHNRTTVKVSNLRFNVPVADSSFTWADPRRRGPRG